MTRFLDFDAARAEEEGDPLTFTLGGESFTCVVPLLLGPVVDLTEHTDAVGVGAIPYLQTFLEAVVVEEDRPKVAGAVKATDYDTLILAAQGIVSVLVGFPTMPPSDSPTPRRPSGGSSKNGSRPRRSRTG